MANPVTPVGIFAFVNINRPAMFDGVSTDKYELTILFDKSTDISALKKACMEAAQAKFGAKADFSYLKHPFVDGDSKDPEKYTGYAGKIAVKFITYKKPEARDKDLNVIMDYDEVYSGAIGRVSYFAQAYDNKSKGVKLVLCAVQKLADGERIGGVQINADEDFATPVDGNVPAAPAATQTPAGKTADPFGGNAEIPAGKIPFFNV